MQLTDQGRQKIDELARRYAVSTDAVMAMLQAVVNGHGSMAQFSHPELGGSGQWMQGGMTMVGDMFNYGLKSKVDGLCSELSQLLGQQPFVPPPASTQSQSQQDGASLFVPDAPGLASGHWWPAELGSPNGTGAQNQIRYAYFNPARRLAVDLNGHITVYDTLDHQVGGVSQQQGGGSSLTFTSQYGTVGVSSLPACPWMACLAARPRQVLPPQQVLCPIQVRRLHQSRRPHPHRSPRPMLRRLRRPTSSPRSSGSPTCAGRVSSRSRSSPRRKPSCCPGCEPGAGYPHNVTFRVRGPAPARHPALPSPGIIS